jgi:Flp pilus assembly protein TadG
MVEFAFVGVLLVLLLTAIITFGLLLSFKQDMTRAAAEGARAGAVASSGTAWQQASDATKEAVRGFDKDCDAADGLTCNINLHDCTSPVASRTPSNPTSTGDCVTVELVYDHDRFPLLPKFPILSAMLPDEMSDSSVARLN